MSSRPVLGSRIVGLTFVVTAMGVASCDGSLVNLGQGQIGNANATGGAVATGGTATTTGSNGGGQITATTASGGAGSGGGGQPTSLAQAGATPSTGGSAQAGAAGLATVVEPKFTDVMRVPSLASGYEDDNPTLTSDMKELYFSSKDRPEGKGNVDVWVAKRDNADADFGEPIPVLAVSTNSADNSPAISADGLTIWVAFAPATGSIGADDIMQATRASRNDDFGTPMIVKELSSEKDDRPRPLGYHNLIMPLGSRRDDETFMTYFATRAAVGLPFGNPVLKSELIVAGFNVADGFLTDDGLTLYFSRSINESGDLFVAFRSSVSAPFGTAFPLSTINTTFDDRDPWLSPDGTRLYFTSDRHEPGKLNIYQAKRAMNQ